MGMQGIMFKDRTGQDRTGQDRTGQDRTGQDRTGQAYLIIAHNEFAILKKILCILDDKNSDIYIHIDKKAGDYDKSELHSCVKESNLYFTKRLDVQWGAYSQIACEMLLLREAVNHGRRYSHYHLVSGVDMPLKTPKEVQEFMMQRQGTSFIALDPSVEGHPERFMDRIKYYYPLGEIIGKPKGILKLTLHYLQLCFLWMQKIVNVDRTRKVGDIFFKGANWFSLTHEMALYVLGQERFIEKCFSHSFCTDEVFLQTVAYRSPLKETIENDSLRCIDWERGMPYVFRAEDFDMLVNSGKLFARKFSTSVDGEIIDRIYDYLMEKKRLEE